VNPQKPPDVIECRNCHRPYISSRKKCPYCKVPNDQVSFEQGGTGPIGRSDKPNVRLNPVFVVVIAVTTIAAIGVSLTLGDSKTGNKAPSVSTGTTAAYKLAVIDGDASEESEFQAAIDCIQMSGMPGTGTEEEVGDTIYSSWQASARSETLLVWAKALCSTVSI
jgi:hypothetical protein